MIGYIFIAITIAALAAVPIALTIVVVKLTMHLRQQKIAKGEIDIVEEVKAFFSSKEEVEKK